MRIPIAITLMALIIPSAIGGEKPATNLADYRLTTDGLGPLKIGMTSAQVINAGFPLGAPKYGFDSQVCEQYPLAGHKGISLLFQDGRLTRVQVTTTSVQTRSGAHVGMRADQVERIYGKKLEVLHFAEVGEEGGGGTMRLYSGDRKSSVVFQTDEDSVHGTKRRPVVTQIRSGPAADRYESCL